MFQVDQGDLFPHQVMWLWDVTCRWSSFNPSTYHVVCWWYWLEDSLGVCEAFPWSSILPTTRGKYEVHYVFCVILKRKKLEVGYHLNDKCWPDAVLWPYRDLSMALTFGRSCWLKSLVTCCRNKTVSWWLSTIWGVSKVIKWFNTHIHKNHFNVTDILQRPWVARTHLNPPWLHVYNTENLPWINLLHFYYELKSITWLKPTATVKLVQSAAQSLNLCLLWNPLVLILLLSLLYTEPDGAFCWCC